MRFILALTMILCMSFSIGNAQNPIDVYLFAGQSNMTGFLGSTGVPSPVPSTNAGIPYNYVVTAGATTVQSDGWETLKTVWSTGGSEISFADEMTKRQDKDIAIIKVAANGTSLYVEWSLTNPISWYSTFRDRVNGAITDLEADGYAPTLAGMFWVQGEADSTAAFRANAYQSNLSNFISQVRADIGDVPFYFNKLHSGSDHSEKSTIRNAQQWVDDNVANTTSIIVDDLTLVSDNVHFEAASQIELGRRWADLIHPSADFDYDSDVDQDDLNIWKNSYGTSLEGDGYSDGVSNGRDFLLWQNQYAPATINSIPEPSTLVMCGVMAILCTKGRPWL